MGKRRSSVARPEEIAELPTRLDGTVALREMAAAHRSIRRLMGADGVISPPDVVREYGDVLPGLASRIVDWAEREAEHRRAMERSLLRLSWAGLWCALAVTLVTITGGMVLALQGRSTAGLAGIVGAVAGLVIVFVAGRRRLVQDSASAQDAT